MLSSKNLFVAAILVAGSVLFLGASMANAEWMTPTANWDHSPSDGTTLKTALFDGDQGTYYKLANDGVGVNAVTNYVILDLGEEKEVSGFKFQPRIHASAETGPQNLDIFFMQNEALMPSEGFSPNTTATLAADSNVVIAASRTLPAIHGSGDSYETSFSSGETFQARYVGLWCRSSYDGTGSADVTCYAEVQFNTSPIPEPSTIVLLATGLIGLLAYAWRRRK